MWERVNEHVCECVCVECEWVRMWQRVNECV